MPPPAMPTSPPGACPAIAPDALPGSPPGAPLAPGSCLGKYRLLSLIGRGGMGVVHEAQDRVLARRVAIKTPRPDACATRDVDALRQRFLSEARLAGRLDHPLLVAVHDFGEAAGRPFIVMERVRGRPLSSRLRTGQPQALAELAAWALPLLAALDAVHRAGIVHRDVKPANVFLTDTGGLKLGDFGVAVAWRDGTSPASARARSRPAGTPGYAAPEQWQPGQVTPAADLFAVGVLLHQALTGRRPASAPPAGGQPPPSRWRADLPPSLDALVQAATSPVAAQRPVDAAAFAGTLRQALAEAGLTDEPRAAAVHATTGRAAPAWRREAACLLHRADGAFAEADAALDAAQCLVADGRLLAEGEAQAARADGRAASLHELGRALAARAADARGHDAGLRQRLEARADEALSRQAAQRAMATRLRALHRSLVDQLTDRLDALEERLALLEAYGAQDARAVAQAGPPAVPLEALDRRLSALRGAHRQCVAAWRAIEAAGALTPALQARSDAARGRLMGQATRQCAQGEALRRLAGAGPARIRDPRPGS